MSLEKDLPELIQEGIIDDAIAKRIERYYENKATSNTNRLYIVFGVLGAILIGARYYLNLSP